MKIRVEAPSRLHFGLLHLPGTEPQNWPGIGGMPGLPIRHFGGVGVMITAPGVGLTVGPADTWQAEGPLAARALEFAQRLVESLPPNERRPFRICVERCPLDHIGLGTGTQLGLSVAKALALLLGHDDWSVAELARRIGRGGRSALGLHGFTRGGFLVEAGHPEDSTHSPLVIRQYFPPSWCIVLFRLTAIQERWHGQREKQAFLRIARHPAALSLTETLCRLVMLGMLPALIEEDVHAFGEAVYEFNARVGMAFAVEQGGIYAGPEVAELVGWIRKEGVTGVGQSSWGPTVFAIVPTAEAGEQLMRAAHTRWSAQELCTEMTTVQSEGARIERLESS